MDKRNRKSTPTSLLAQGQHPQTQNPDPPLRFGPVAHRSEPFGSSLALHLKSPSLQRGKANHCVAEENVQLDRSNR